MSAEEVEAKEKVEAKNDGGLVPKVETQNQRNKRLAREAIEAEEARILELKRQQEASRREAEEKQRVERERVARLDRRASRIEKILRKFVASHAALLDSMKTVAGAKKETVKKSRKEREKEKSSTRRKPPSPEQSSWIEMLTEIDLKINESKVCSLDDILPGFSKLTEEEQQQMIGIVQSIGKKSLPKGRDLKDTYSVIHKTLMMATLSKSYRREKIPVMKSATTATDLRNKGFSTREVHELGYNTHSLRAAKCRIEEIVDAVDSLEQLCINQITVNEIAKADSVKHQIGGYRGAMKLKAAGYRANDIRKAGTHSAWELRMAGYDLEQLKGAGFLIPNLREAGFGTKALQPPGEGLNAVVSSTPASYEYEESQAKLRALHLALSQGHVTSLDFK